LVFSSFNVSSLMTPAVGVIAALLLLFAALPFVRPMAAFVRRR
jgi:hypothetical protein